MSRPALREAGTGAPPLALATARASLQAAGAMAAFLVLAALITYRASANLNVPGAPNAPFYGLGDFRDGVYYPAVAFLNGVNPYDPTTYMQRYPVAYPYPWYLPESFVIHLPFALLPVRASGFTYLAFGFGLVLLLAAIALRGAGLAVDTTRVFGLGALILASRPGHWTLFIGQCSTLAVVGAAAALVYARSRPLLATLALGLAAFKPTFGLPLAVLLAARGDRGVVLGGLAVAGVISVLATAVLVTSAGGLAPFLASLGASHAAFSAEAEVDPASSWSRIDAVALLGRLLGWSPGGAVEAGLGLALLGLGALVVATRAGADLAHDGGVSIGLICLTLLVCSYHQGYDLLLLALPLTGLAVAGGASPWRQHPRLRVATLLLLAVPMVNYLGSGSAMEAIGLEGTWWTAATSVGPLALLAALVIMATLAWRRDGD